MERRFSRTAVRYLKSWFLLDVLIVARLQWLLKWVIFFKLAWSNWRHRSMLVRYGWFKLGLYFILDLIWIGSSASTILLRSATEQVYPGFRAPKSTPPGFCPCWFWGDSMDFLLFQYPLLLESTNDCDCRWLWIGCPWWVSTRLAQRNDGSDSEQLEHTRNFCELLLLGDLCSNTCCTWTSSIFQQLPSACL